MEINGVNSSLHLSALKTGFGGYLCKIFQLLDEWFKVIISKANLGHLGIESRRCSKVAELFFDGIV